MTTLIKYFGYEHLAHTRTREIAQLISILANRLEEEIPESAEKTVGMRKLLESKDCFVRSVLDITE